MLKICLTADHEIYFGDNFIPEEQIVVDPTDQLMEALESCGVPITLMTDVCAVRRFRECRPESSFPALVEDQLKRALTRGHDVQLHLHPHWQQAEWDGGSWSFDHHRFRLHDWGFDAEDPSSAVHLVRGGVRYLEELLKPVEPSYRCIGFRAGGWCLQPEEVLLRLLYQEGIRIDTTVFRGGYLNTAIKPFDFRNAPDLPCWWVDPAQGLNVPMEAGPGRLFEIATGSVSNPMEIFPDKLRFRWDRIRHKKGSAPARGRSIDDVEPYSGTMKDRVQELFHRPILLSFDNASGRAMLEICQRYLHRFGTGSEDVYLSVIGHPKTVGKEDLKELVWFCTEMKRQHPDDVRFITLREAAQEKDLL